MLDYPKNARPTTPQRQIFFTVLAPRVPIGWNAIANRATHSLRKAGIRVRRPGSHTLRHTCVQRLIDAQLPLKTIGDYVGHRRTSSTEIYTKVALTEEEVREPPDAITLCQAGAIDGKIIVSPDHDFQADRLAANAWAVARHRAGTLAQPMIVTRPERELEDWCAAQPQAVLQAVIATAWPNDPQAARTSIEARLSTLLDKMTKVDYLQPTARFCKQLYANHREPSRLIEEVRASLPTRARAADARHPANPDNRARNWARPDDSVRDTINLPRWRLYVTEQVFHIEANQSGSDYTAVDQIPIDDRARIIETLIERNIEVQGTPEHGGSQGGASGGFSIAMNGLIDEELVKTRAITR